MKYIEDPDRKGVQQWLQHCPHCNRLLDVRELPQNRRRRKAPCCGKLIRLVDDD